jgi:hypothetical protein
MNSKLVALSAGLLFLINCAGLLKKDSVTNNGISISKSSEYSSDNKKISTFPAYFLEAGKLDDKSDTLITVYGSTIQSKINEMNGNNIEGGDAIVSVISKLKLNDPFQKAMKDFANNGSNLSSDTSKFLSDFAEKTKVDGFVLPVITAGYDNLKKGSTIDLRLYLFDNKLKAVSLSATYNGIKATNEEIITANQNNDQGRAIITASILKKTSELTEAIRKETKSVLANAGTSVSGNVGTDPNSSVVKAEEKQELSFRQKMVVYIYTGAIFASWFIGVL